MDHLDVSFDSMLRATGLELGVYDNELGILDFCRLAYLPATEELTQVSHCVSVSQSAATSVRDESRMCQSLPGHRIIPTTEDWETQKSTIIRLYVDNDCTLNEVMKFMQDRHAFNASKKMYKSRFTAWKVRKYMTRAERDIACRAIKAKQHAGKKYERIMVRGKERTPDVFLRHMKKPRAGLRRRRLLRDTTPRNVPDIIIGDLLRNHSGSSIRPIMYPAGPERTAEIVCAEISGIVSSLSEITLSMDLSRFWRGAFSQSTNCRPIDTRLLLNGAAAWFYERIQSQPARTLLSFLHSQVRNSRRTLRNVEMFNEFNGHILELTETVYGGQHSITRILSHMLELGHNAAVINRVYQQVLKLHISRLARQQPFTVSNWNDRLTLILRRLGQYQEAKALVAALPIDEVNSDGQRSFYQIPYSWASSFKHVWDYVQCAFGTDRVLIEMVANSLDLATRHAPTKPFSPVTMLAEKRGDADTTREFCELYMQAEVDWLWAYDHKTLAIVDEFAEYLRSQGRDDEAEEVDGLYRLNDNFSERSLG